VAARYAAVEELHSALERFQATTELPPRQDHAGPVLWIAKVVQEAWEYGNFPLPRNADPVSFDKNDGAPLALFIQLTLEGTGLAREGEAGHSLGAISDRLRERQNRKRNRGAHTRGGGKAIQIAPVDPVAEGR